MPRSQRSAPSNRPAACEAQHSMHSGPSRLTLGALAALLARCCRLLGLLLGLLLCFLLGCSRHLLAVALLALVALIAFRRLRAGSCRRGGRLLLLLLLLLLRCLLLCRGGAQLSQQRIKVLKRMDG